MPAAEGEPVHSSGSMPTFAKTSGSTMPAPPSSIQPVNLHVRQPCRRRSAGDVRLDRRLGEREVVRAEADLALLAEERPHHVQRVPLRSASVMGAVDGEALELVEDREARRVISSRR